MGNLAAIGSTIDVVLDLRSYLPSITTAKECIGLWKKLEANLNSQRLELGERYALQHPVWGTVGIEPIALPTDTIEPESRIAVYSTLQTPQVKYPCEVCLNQGEQVYGQFFCYESAQNNSLTWLCEDHAILLDGTTRAFHPQKFPKCSSNNGAHATFFCFGPKCQRGRAWSDAHKTTHPADRRVYFCTKCHEELFPSCHANSCEKIGYFKCEFVDPQTEKACGARTCGRHTYRWQIYGPDKEGLAYCPAHRGIRSLNDVDVVKQMVLGTALRRLKFRPGQHRPRPYLPTLATAKHIFIHVREKPYSYSALHTLFDQTQKLAKGDSRLMQEVHRLVQEKTAFWDKERKNDFDAKELGKQMLGNVKAVYQEMGHHDVAESLRLSDYKPGSERNPTPLMFVYIDEGLIGLFKGRQHATLRAVEQRLRVRIQLERDQAGRNGRRTNSRK